MGMPKSWHLRQAMVIAGQLPENKEDALAILAAVTDLVENYLSKSQDEPDPKIRVKTNILPFVS